MYKQDFSRREFLKQNSITGLGALMATGIAPSIFANSLSASDMPAILGGKPAFTEKWPKWPQWIAETDEKRVLEVLRSGVWSRDAVVTEFENKWAKTIGSKRSLMVVNGTSALAISLIQNNIGAGDEVLIPPYTYVATAVAVLNAGAMPVFVDTDPETFQIDPSKIEAKITPRTKAIMPVHFAGLPADMIRIMDIAKKHKLIVIEDACQAHLAEINHQKVGTFGHAGCFSFQNSKILPIGEGGAIVSDDEGFVDRCYSYHNFGFPFGAIIANSSEISVLKGNKLRMSEYQAAIGLAQLTRLDHQTTTRNENAEYLRSQMQRIPGIIPIKLVENVTRGSYYIFPFRYKKEDFKELTRAGFTAALEAEGVSCLQTYPPLNTMPFLADALKSKNYQIAYSQEKLDFGKYLIDNACPENDKLCQEAIWFYHPLLLAGKSAMNHIAEAISKIHKYAGDIKKIRG
ncbi:MAG: DegT/DnrJ/EryC1/StrS family aminotransferase [Ginsengibacter sp.]